MTLMVVDSNFNKEKADIIYNMLEYKQLTAFTFSNIAPPVDWEQD